MEPFENHPLYIRLQKVIDSCETYEQHQVAVKYSWLAYKRIIAERMAEIIADAIYADLKEDGWNLTK